MTEHKYTNALINESSPYLLQHAHNPVNWEPWSDEAFEKAEQENKLVLISVGYSACHWCHVMEHETFEDSTAAAFMNEHFVCIKVDREERPDVDQVYMDAVQLMTQRGGWPLNCFTLPDARPIYGGTYFPKDDWMDIMNSLVTMKEKEPEKMIEYASKLTEGIQGTDEIVKIENDEAFRIDEIDVFVSDWMKYWDEKEGGPNRAPKFPLPNNYEFLMHYGTVTQNQKAIDFTETTLDKMAYGGIYDQIGGGFARYSTDAIWKVPHFEKMLYDNGQLVSLYSKAYQKFKKPLYKDVVYESIEFVLRELTAENGAFYSALDADSEGEEGKFYVWTKEELQEVLKDDFELASKYFSVNRKGLWEHENYILLRDESLEKFLVQEELEVSEFKPILDRMKSKLMSARDKRIRPGLDDKTIISWNALMIKGLSDAYQAFGERKFLDAAIKNAEFIEKNQIGNKGLLRIYKDGKSSIDAYLDDYSFLIEAYVSLYQSTFDEKWLALAKSRLSEVHENFFDEETGMFWYTSKDSKELIARKKELSDNVIPASNSSLAKSFFQVGTYYYDQELLSVSEQMLRNIQPHMTYGQGYSNWAMLHLWFANPPYEVAITGSNYQSLASEMNTHYLPNVLLMGGEKGKLPLLEGKFLDEGTIFVCQNKSCQLPVNEVKDALEQIK